uniref:Uncharacterized protein n=1 Tax=Cacopsylla melanoneura TaxID=428564 RepID=A0A8D9A9P4_9HEMI
MATSPRPPPRLVIIVVHTPRYNIVNSMSNHRNVITRKTPNWRPCWRVRPPTPLPPRPPTTIVQTPPHIPPSPLHSTPPTQRVVLVQIRIQVEALSCCPICPSRPFPSRRSAPFPLPPCSPPPPLFFNTIWPITIENDTTVVEITCNSSNNIITSNSSMTQSKKIKMTKKKKMTTTLPPFLPPPR